MITFFGEMVSLVPQLFDNFASTLGKTEKKSVYEA